MILQKRRVPCLDQYLNGLTMMLWPRFQAIIDAHIKSLRDADARKLLPNKEVNPHYVSPPILSYILSFLGERIHPSRHQLCFLKILDFSWFIL